MRKIIVVWLAIMLIGGMFGFLNPSMDAEVNTEDAGIKSASQSKSGLTPHDPIYISGNSGFTDANGVTNGTGTAGDPYIIENWDINTSTAAVGIYIGETDAYFIIRDCVVYDGGDSGNGVCFSYVQNGKIGNVISYNNYRGIRLDSSSNNTIISNQIYNNWNGIVLGSSSDNIISANQIYNNSRGSINLQYSSNNTISANQIYNNKYGIGLYSSSNNTTISANQIYNNTKDEGIYTGIYLWDSSNNILQNNILENNTYNFGVLGGDISYFYQDIDTSNTINGKPIYYIIEQNDLVFDGVEVGYLGLVSCSNILVKNLTLTDNMEGLLLANTSYSTITANQIYNNKYGIGLYSSSNNNTISANQIYNNYYGIYLFYSSNNNITGNQIYNNTFNGISLYKSSSNEIHYNDIYDTTDYGIGNGPSEPQYLANATYNWWGSGGTGANAGKPGEEGNNRVSSNVLYDPWLTEPWTGVAPNHIPTVSITFPSPDITVSGTITIQGTSFDTDGTVQSVEVSIDDNTFATNKLTVSGTTSWSASWDTTEYADGSHTVYVRPYDGTDYSNIDSVTVTVNNVAGADDEEDGVADAEEPEKKEDEGFIPGFESAAFLVAMVGVCAILLRKRKDP